MTAGRNSRGEARAGTACTPSARAGPLVLLPGQRALGDFDDTSAEQSAAALMAAEAIGALRDALGSLDRWAAWRQAPELSLDLNIARNQHVRPC
jgi:hypothetical protein